MPQNTVMIVFDREPAFVLKRSLHGENHYRLDLLSENHGLFQAIARIKKRKTHRSTENYAPFRELAISGRQKSGLASLWDSEILTRFTLGGHHIMNASYLNELILSFAAQNDAPQELYALYRTCLYRPDSPCLRRMEWFFIRQLGVFPEILGTAAAYRFLFTAGAPVLSAAPRGYDRRLIAALGENRLLNDHPQLQSFLQTLLSFYSTRRTSTRATTSALYRLLKTTD